MRLEIIGTANTGAAQAGVDALTAQVELLNKAMERTTVLSKGATPKSFYNTANALKASNTTFKNALASTGQFHIQQLKVNDATEHYTKLLQKQNLGFRQVFGPQNKAMMDSIYHRQLAFKNLTSSMITGAPGDGSLRSIMAIPRGIPAEWDNFNNKVGFASERLRAVGANMVKTGKNLQWGGRQLTVGLTMPVVAFGAAAGVMAYKADAAFTRIRKVYNTTANQFSSNVEEQKASQKELDQLRVDGMKTATDAARAYGVSISDTLNVQADLAATGQRGIALQKATTEVVKNATLGEIDYATATKATIAMQQILHLNTKDLADTWAYMNSVENQTSLTMKDFATAIPIALGPLKEMGGDVQTLGTLLTGMVSRGIQVGKAANSIKAAMQRLIRPSKQVQSEFKAITGSDIVQIGQRNKGNLLGMLKDIYEVTKNLSHYDKTKVFAGLFGSFQVSNMAAMVDSMGDLQKGIGQVSTAQQIGTQNAKQWGQVQQQEINQFQQSISGKFKRSIASIGAELAQMGMPFLQIATDIIGAITAVLHAFNGLPGAEKKAALYVALFVAAFGPIKMLAGLVRQLIGSIAETIGAVGMRITKWTGSVTAEQKAMAISAEQAENAFKLEADAAELLAKNLEAVNYALAQQATAVQHLSKGAVVLPAESAGAMTNDERFAYYRSQTPRGPGGQFVSNATKDAYAAEQMKQYEASMAGAAARSGQVAENTRKMGTGMKIAAGGGALFAASMVASMVSSNKTVDKIAQMGMALGMLGPLLAPLLTNPFGIAAAGAAALGIVVYKWYQHEKKITEEKRAQNLAMYKQNDELNKALGIEQDRLKTMQSFSALDSNKKANAGTTVQDVATSFQSSDTGKQVVSSVQNAASEQDKLTIATKEYFDVLNSKGGSVQKAKLAVAGLFFAAGESMAQAADRAEKMYKAIGDTTSFAQKSKLFMSEFAKAMEGDDTSIQQQGTALGQLMIDAMKRSSAKEAPHLFDGLDKVVADSWGRNFKNLDGLSQKVFTDAGVKGRDSFNNIISKVGDMAEGKLSQGDFLKQFKLQANELDPLLAAINKMKLAMDNDKGLKLEKAIVQEYVSQLHLSKDIVTIDQLRANWQFKLQFATKETSKELYKQRIAELSSLGVVGDLLGVHKKLSDATKQQVRDELNAAIGMNGYGKKADDAKQKLAGVNTELAKMPQHKDIEIVINSKDIVNIQQQAMSGVMSDMSTMATNQMDSAAQAAMDAASAAGQRQIDAAQAAGQRAQDALQARQDKATQALQDRQQAEQVAFDKHWQHREDVINKYYDKREGRIDREIKAEARAEVIRQRIYDAEQARLDHMTESMNQNIDFNVALQTGQLDEAAKIQNDITASATSFALSQQGTQEANKSQDKQDRLSAQKDRLEKERQARLKNFQKEEDDARRHLQRLQDLENRALQKKQDAESKALQASLDARNKAIQTEVDNNNAALQAEWDARKTNLQDQLTLFTSYVAKNKTDLTKWMNSVGLQYSDFGINTLKPMSDTWGTYFQTAFQKHLRQAGAAVASDNMWTKLGTESVKALLAGMGFPTMAGFRKFISTGNLPSNFGKKPKPHQASPGTPAGPGSPHHHGNTPTGGGFHVGGRFGIDKGGRLGRTGPLRPDEGYALLKHGEMVMNPAASEKYEHQLRQMNSEGLGKGGYTGAPGLMPIGAAIADRLFAMGVGKALGLAYTDAKAAKKAARHAGRAGHVAGGYVPGPGGKHRPVPAGIGLVRGIHDQYTGYPAIDIAAGLNTPAYAVGNGTITQSRAITSGGTPGNGMYSIPYSSYGNVIYLKLDGGPEVLYAHLNKRLVGAGKRVKGGSQIGLTGNTGNSTGPHLHFGDNDGNPMEFMSQGGDIMRSGKFYGHGGEKVLRRPLSRALDKTVQAFGELSADPKLRYHFSKMTGDHNAALRNSSSEGASSITNHYTIPMTIVEPGATADEIVDKVVKKIERIEGRRPTKRTNRT